MHSSVTQIPYIQGPVPAPKRIAILLYPGVEPLDYQGPCAIFDLWHLELQGPEVILLAEEAKPIPCAYGRSLLPQYGFAKYPPFDALLVPGGPGRKEAIQNRLLMNFLQEQGALCDHLLSVCTGCFLLAAAGLLSGLHVTTHWEFVEDLKRDTRLHVDGQQRYIQDGHVWTAAGICAGIDLALAFIHSFEGTPRADSSMRQAEAETIRQIAQYSHTC